MSTHPIFERMFADMARAGLLPPPQVVDLHAERVRREREASERRHEARKAGEPGDAA